MAETLLTLGHSARNGQAPGPARMHMAQSHSFLTTNFESDEIEQFLSSDPLYDAVESPTPRNVRSHTQQSSQLRLPAMGAPQNFARAPAQNRSQGRNSAWFLDYSTAKTSN